LTGNTSLNPDLILLPPNAPSIFHTDGSLNWEDWDAAGLSNPLEGYFNTTKTDTKNLNTNLAVSYEIFSGFRLKSSFGYADFASNELWKLPIRSYASASNPVNRSSHLSTNRKSWIIEPQLAYDQNFGKLETNLLIGGTLQKNRSDRSSFQGQGYASESLIGDLGSAERIINASSVQAEYKYVALFSRIGLNWDKKYFLNLTGRRDGSSRFGPNNKFASFGAIGAAWILSEEPFFSKGDGFLSFAKLRGSYGSTGNDQIGDYGYLDAYQATAGPGGLYPVALANPDYSWEINKKLELAAEFGFFEDKVNLGVSWYRNRSSNQLVGYALPYLTGFNSVQANLPATVQNRGWEIELATVNFSNENFTWNTNLNLSFPKNKLLSYPDIDQSSYANTYRVGEPLNIALLYEYVGLDPETGLYKLRDVNGDGNLSFEDQVISKNLNREFFGGVNNSVRYRNFNLAFLLQFVKQEGRLSEFQAGTNSNVLDLVLDNDKYQRYTASYEGSVAFIDAVNSDFSFTDASFLRLKTLSLGYNLPTEWIKKLQFNQVRLFIHGQNLITWTPFEGLDPELPTSAISLGNLRSVSAGLQLNF
ncbi:MAG: SusC/RagA family TonB-linked outer membrane protein, partial [Christiangramia sp.]